MESDRLIDVELPEPEWSDVELHEIEGDDCLIGEVYPELLRSVRQAGVLVPVVLIRQGPGFCFKVADGRRRVKAARAAGLKEVPACVYPKDTPTSMISLTTNAVRKPNALTELADIEDYIDQGKSLTDIFQATGMPVGKIKSRLKMRKLDPYLRCLWEEGKIQTGVAEECAIASPAIQRAVVEEFLARAEKDPKATLTVGHVKTAKQVGSQHAASLLPDSLFLPVVALPGAKEAEVCPLESGPPKTTPIGVVSPESLSDPRDQSALYYLMDHLHDMGLTPEAIIGTAVQSMARRKGWQPE